MDIYGILKAKAIGNTSGLSHYDALIASRFIGGGTLIGTDSEPYLYRSSPSLGAYKTERDEIVGVSVGFNQLCATKMYTNNSTTDTRTYLSMRIASGSNYMFIDSVYTVGSVNKILSATYSGTSVIKHSGSSNDLIFASGIPIISGHKYFVHIKFTGIDATTIHGVSADEQEVIDLTALLGSTIADYIYSLEQGTTGSGVAFFKRYFGADYYPYDSGSIRSVEGLVSHTMKDENDNIIGEYPLDSTVTLRGHFVLDNGKLKAEGDVYPSSGEVQRRYDIVDLGTLNWTYDGVFTATVSGIKSGVYTDANLICAKYPTMPMSYSAFTYGLRYNSATSIGIKDPAYTDAPTFKTAMNGVYLVYELATPTTDTAQPFAKNQKVSPSGTEEYVTTSVVPVGHNTEYYG